MFRKSRRKIVVAIMSVLVALWVGTLSIIFASSYFEMSKQNKQMLQAHAQMYTLSSFEGTRVPNKPFHPGNYAPDFGFEKEKVFQLSTFYTVALNYQGKILEIKNDPPTVHTDNELEDLAKDIVKGKKEAGTKDNLAYYKTDKNGYILVSFKDNTLLNESTFTLLRYTLIFGGAALVLFFFLSVILARKIVNPLEEIYQKQKTFISDAGHELKTPVAVVSANAELLSRKIGDNPWLQNIQYENERMGKLVIQLLDLARTEHTKPQMERIDFSRLTEGEALPFESVAFEKNLTLCGDIAEKITVEGSSSQLKQLVSILLDNAICHSKGGDRVYLSLSKEHGWAKLCVINKGEEIPPKERERIFERFYRSDPARSSKGDHYGLGLAIAKKITEVHKGQIEVLCYDNFVEFRVKIPAV